MIFYITIALGLSQWRVKHAQVADAGEAWPPAGHLEQIINIVG